VHAGSLQQETQSMTSSPEADYSDDNITFNVSPKGMAETILMKSLKRVPMLTSISINMKKRNKLFQIKWIRMMEKQPKNLTQVSTIRTGKLYLLNHVVFIGTRWKQQC
jgi:hypothetical protein